MPQNRIIIITPARQLFYAFCCLVGLVCFGSWLFGMYEHIDLASTSVPEFEVKSQLLSIRRKLDRGDDTRQFMAVPEGQLFVHSFYGYALINTALDSAPGSEARANACAELEKILDRIAQLNKCHPFDTNVHLKPSGGIIIAGHSNLLRAGYVLLGGKSEKIKEQFHTGSKEIADSFLCDKLPFPPCYAGLTWAQDSIFALESLRLHDVIFKSDYSRSREAWLSWMKSHLDPASGMMVAQPDLQTGQVLDGPRGCALSWALAFLPNIDPEFARQQYTLFRNNWFVPFAGMLGINEWYHGQAQPTDFPTGPVVFGLGEAATGIGIGAARANGDYYSWHSILRALSLLGFPQWTPTMEKSYFYGQCMLADSIAVWGETVRPWDTDSQPQARYRPLKGPQSAEYLLVCAVATLVATAIVGTLALRTYKSFTDQSAVRTGWKKATILAFALQSIAAIAFLTTTAFAWFQLLIFMAGVDLFEEMTIRPRIVGEKYGLSKT